MGDSCLLSPGHEDFLMWLLGPRECFLWTEEFCYLCNFPTFSLLLWRSHSKINQSEVMVNNICFLLGSGARKERLEGKA